MKVKTHFQNTPAVIQDKADASYTVEHLTPPFTEAVAQLYRSAYDRGEHFSSNYPNKEIQNPEWVKWKTEDPFFTWLIIRDGNTLVGSETLYESPGKVFSDETQVAPEYRSKGLLYTLFDFVFGEVQNNFPEYIVGGEILFWPYTSSMRRITQGKYDWKAVGIFPNRFLGADNIWRSLLPAYHYPSLPPVQARLIKPAVPLYHVVQTQLGLPEPEVVDIVPDVRRRNPKEYIEASVDLKDYEEQAELYRDGFTPVAITPERNQLVMARFPLDGLPTDPRAGKRAYDFIFDESGIYTEADRRLVEFIYSMADRG